VNSHLATSRQDRFLPHATFFLQSVSAHFRHARCSLAVQRQYGEGCVFCVAYPTHVHHVVGCRCMLPMLRYARRRWHKAERRPIARPPRMSSSSVQAISHHCAPLVKNMIRTGLWGVNMTSPNSYCFLAHSDGLNAASAEDPADPTHCRLFWPGKKMGCMLPGSTLWFTVTRRSPASTPHPACLSQT
jgi:hypothetical protein